jgi:hypothetical protein
VIKLTFGHLHRVVGVKVNPHVAIEQHIQVSVTGVAEMRGVARISHCASSTSLREADVAARMH